MKTFALAAAVTAVFINLLISPAQADPRADEAKTIVKTFAETLQGELKTALKAGGPTQAVDVCHERAPAIAAELSTKTGWEVGRTSLKRRNAGNTPDDWERDVMMQFEQRKAAGEDPAKLAYGAVVEDAQGKRFRFMKAIPTQPVCLTCHGGDSVPAEVEAKLRQYYPDDQARGFKEGDLRGAFTLAKPAG